MPEPLKLNHWALAGDWTVESGASVPNQDGRIAFRFHARDAHLVMGPQRTRHRGAVPRARRRRASRPAHGRDVDEDGHGTLAQQRLHQLIRQPGSIRDRTFEITFPDAGVEAYCFTFG